MSARVRPSELRVGDFLESEPDVYVVEIYIDVDGVWVEWSDGDRGYMTRAVRIMRDV